MMDSRLKIFSCVSELYEGMLNGFFLPSVPSDCLPVLRFFSTGPQRFRTGEWHKIMAKKLDLVLDAIAGEPEGTVFVLSDLDIQFFRPFAEEMRRLMDGYEVLFQHDRADWEPPSLSALCAGFMVIRACSASSRFFEDARGRMRRANTPEVDDQAAIRTVIASGSSPIKAGLLPTRYWTYGTDRPVWSLGKPIHPPGDIVMHHSNWVLGQTKIDQLRTVREIVTARGTPKP